MLSVALQRTGSTLSGATPLAAGPRQGGQSAAPGPVPDRIEERDGKVPETNEHGWIVYRQTDNRSFAEVRTWNVRTRVTSIRSC